MNDFSAPNPKENEKTEDFILFDIIDNREIILNRSQQMTMAARWLLDISDRYFGDTLYGGIVSGFSTVANCAGYQEEKKTIRLHVINADLSNTDAAREIFVEELSTVMTKMTAAEIRRPDHTSDVRCKVLFNDGATSYLPLDDNARMSNVLDLTIKFKGEGDEKNLSSPQIK